MPKRAQTGAVLGEAVTTSGGGRGSWYVVMQPRAHERARPSARSPQASGEPEGVCGPQDSCWGEMAVIEVVRPLRLRTEREIVACAGCKKHHIFLSLSRGVMLTIRRAISLWLKAFVCTLPKYVTERNCCSSDMLDQVLSSGVSYVGDKLHSRHATTNN